MKHLLIVIILGLSQPLFAASPVWLVESAENRLFLAGTIHVLRASDYPLPGAFESAYKQSQILSFETDIGGSSNPAFQMELMKAVTLSQNKTLQDFISPQTYAKLDSYFRENKLNLKQFSKFKPSMVAMTLTLLELKKLGAGGQGVDQSYFNMAQRHNKTTIALETLQQQINFIANMGKGQEDMMMRQTLEDIDSLSTQFSLMVKSWREGDIKQMEELFIKPMKEDYETLYQELLVQRNINWMPQIFDYLKTPQTEMVLVGSAHLIGEDGLLIKLKQAGYKVTQLD